MGLADEFKRRDAKNRVDKEHKKVEKDAEKSENVASSEDETEPPVLSPEEVKQEWAKVRYFLEVWTNPKSTIRDRLNAVPKEQREKLWHKKYKRNVLSRKKRFLGWRL